MHCVLTEIISKNVAITKADMALTGVLHSFQVDVEEIPPAWLGGSVLNEEEARDPDLVAIEQAMRMT